MEGPVKLMKPFLIIFTFLIGTGAFAQFDTTYYDNGDFTVSLAKDSCNRNQDKLVYPFTGFVVLGNPDELCDRTYYKQGMAFDQKKSFDFGYLYLQYDSAGMVRKHQIKNTLYDYSIALEITHNGQIFFSHIEAQNPTHYFLQPTGRFERVTTTLAQPKDTATKRTLNSFMQRFGPRGLYHKNTSYFPLQYTLHFLRNGMVESFGHYYLPKEGNPIKIGLWWQYNVFCNCYEQREYFVK